MRRCALFLVLILPGCGAGGGEPAARPDHIVEPGRPYIRALGTAQDGGLPHVACTCTRCELARSDPGSRRLVASLALVLPDAEQVYLFDATPDLREQLDRLEDVRHARGGGVDRTPLDGIFLTHAHMGHYVGLAYLGYEAAHAQGISTWVTPRMAAFLRANGPWSQLVELENLKLRETVAGSVVRLSDDVTVELIAVPHREEYSDTVAFLIEGPRRSILYMPDSDGWPSWQDELLALLERADTALIDATFYSADELPGRRIDEIGHPLVDQSVELLGGRVAAGELEVYFTHMNHSNPILEPDSKARRRLEKRGFAVLADGQELPL